MRRGGPSAATFNAVNKMNPTPYSAKTWWWLYAAAALSLYTTLGLPYIGEEAVYTITSLEMRLNHDYFVTTLYGTNYGRPPLLNWLIIPLAEMLGWDRMLLASRLVAATATVLTGLVLAWLTLNLTRNRALAAFAAVVFLSGDALFYRGWLAYADPLLTLCVFGAIACLWVAVLRKEGALLWLAVLLVTCGFLAKVQTAYLFYGVALVVLAADRDARRFLLGAHSIAAHAAAVAVLLAWNAYFTHGTQSAAPGSTSCSRSKASILPITCINCGRFRRRRYCAWRRPAWCSFTTGGARAPPLPPRRSKDFRGERCSPC